MKPFELRDYSPITWGLERAFRAMQLLSISTWLFGARVLKNTQFSDEGERSATTKFRSRRIEAYIAVWFLLEVGAIVWCGGHSLANIAAAWIAAYRLLDIAQASLNLTLFDRLRLTNGPHYVAAIARTVVLSLWNFIEAIICFGLIYSANASLLKNAADSLDPFYFSAITQLTIGYGDLQPLGFLRAVAMAQGAFGFVLGVFAVSRVVAFLPKTTSVMGDEADG